jgi:hypothetical protein
MGVSLATALAIQGNKVSCQAGGPSPDNGKWVGWVMMDVDRWAPLLNTEPIYDSQEEAVSAMKSLVKKIRGLDMDTQKDKLSRLMEV